MASANAGPISGRELIRVIQGGHTVWLNRTEFAALIALPSNPPADRPYNVPTTFLGTEVFEAIQDGSRITMSAADMATYLAASGAVGVSPGPNYATTLTGNERIVGQQDAWRVALSNSEYAATKTAGASQITLPASFLSRWTPSFSLLRSAGGYYFTDLDYEALKPGYEKTYWVAANGNNGNDGTEGSPLLDLSAAIAKTDAATGLRVILNTTAGNLLMPGARGWNNTQPTKNILLEKVGDGRAISIASSTTAAPTWELHSGSIYRTTITAANASSVMDLSIFESDGFNVRQAYVGSEGAMVAGTCYHNGTQLLCWALDGRNLIGDQDMWPCSEANNIRIPSASRTTFIDGLEGVGGAPLIYVAAGVVDPLVVTQNCRFQGSRSSGGASMNNMFYEGPGRFYSRRTASARAYRDAINYTGNANGSPFGFEDECWTGTGGYVGPSDNASTSHNNSAVIRLNGRYRGALNRSVIDINDTRILGLGSLFGQARTVAAGNESLATANTNETWIAGCSFEAGPNPQLSITTNTSTVRYRDMPAPVRAGTGEDLGALAVWS